MASEKEELEAEIARLKARRAELALQLHNLEFGAECERYPAVVIARSLYRAIDALERIATRMERATETAEERAVRETLAEDARVARGEPSAATRWADPPTHTEDPVKGDEHPKGEGKKTKPHR